MNKFTVAHEGLELKHLKVLNERFTGMDVEWIELDRVSPPSVSTIDVLIVKDLEAPSGILCRAGRLRLVVQLDPGKADIDQDALARGGIAYERIQWPAWLGVAEHTLLLMLALVKKFVGSVERTRNNQYPTTIRPKMTTQTDYRFNWTGESGLGVLYRRTLGIVGLGWIGREVAKRAATFDMKVLYYDPRRLSEEEERLLGVTHVSFDELLRRSDFVTLHTRLTSDTERIIDAQALERMKPTAFLINTARGRLVDEDALIDALQSGRIAGAGLDVFWKEPPEPNSPLLSMENVLVTPHHAGIFIGDAAIIVGNYLADAILVSGISKE